MDVRGYYPPRVADEGALWIATKCGFNGEDWLHRLTSHRWEKIGNMADLDFSPLSKFMNSGRAKARSGRELLAMALPKTRREMIDEIMRKLKRGNLEARAPMTEDGEIWYNPYNKRTYRFSDCLDMWIEFEPESAPEPEKSPADRAHDDFIARRKAKREIADSGWGGTQWTPEEIAQIKRRRAAEETAQSLGRAVSRAAPHHTEIHERVMPYRLEVGS